MKSAYSTSVPPMLYFPQTDTPHSLSIFILETNHELPDELVSFCRLLLQSQSEWEKTKSKSKLPKAKVDESILSIIADALERRLAEYPTSVEVIDFPIVSSPSNLLTSSVVVAGGSKAPDRAVVFEQKTCCRCATGREAHIAWDTVERPGEIEGYVWRARQEEEEGRG